MARHRHIEAFPKTTDAHVTSLHGATFPVQVDGDFAGSYTHVRYCVEPRALAVVA